MNDSNAVVLAALGLVTAILTLVVKPLFSLLKANTKATAANTKALQTIAKETTKGNNEAKQRNGHLADLIIQQGHVVEGIADKAVGTILDGVAHQHVDTQTVDKQVIKKEK